MSRTGLETSDDRTAAGLTEGERTRVFLVVIAVALSAPTFVAAVVRGSDDAALDLSRSLLFGALAAALVSRFIQIAVQFEVVDVGLSAEARRRRSRPRLLAAVVWAQWPLALRDLGLGVLGLTGVIGTASMLNLASNLFDPFVLGSVVVFARRISQVLEDPRDARRAIVAFAGFSIVVKLANGVLLSLLSPAIG